MGGVQVASRRIGESNQTAIGAPYAGRLARGPGLVAVILLCALHLVDVTLTMACVARYGPFVEVNPLVGGVLRLGALGAVAWECALLAVILAAGALNPRYWRILIAAGLLSGVIGVASGVVALV
jgi:hypothetical protein